MEEIREPKQKRAIKKKEAIIKAGFNLICKNGYYNTNTKEIAKEAGVSTGIIYQYFKDKHDILMEALTLYGDKIFFPIINSKEIIINNNNIDSVIKEMINYYIENHKISKIAHEELMSMVHSDKEIAKFYYNRELEMTNIIKNIFEKNNYNNDNLFEKSHIILGLIDNLCHEITYHKHENMNYDEMTNITIQVIKNILKMT